MVSPSTECFAPVSRQTKKAIATLGNGTRKAMQQIDVSVIGAFYLLVSNEAQNNLRRVRAKSGGIVLRVSIHDMRIGCLSIA